MLFFLVNSVSTSEDWGITTGLCTKPIDAHNYLSGSYATRTNVKSIPQIKENM